MASIKLTGDTSGEITISAPAVSGTNTLTLPANTGTIITSATAAADVPAPTQLSTASGSAPSYSARAWVNFQGTSTVTIRGSGNVTSITDHGTGDYTVNFTTAMPDVNYCGVALPNDGTAGTNLVIACENQTRTKTVSAFNIWTAYGGNGVNKNLYDVGTVNVSIFR